MTIRHTILSALCLSAFLSAGAQGNRENVELLTIEGSVAVFSSEGFANNKKEAFENSQMAVLHKLLYDGIEGINDGMPIATQDLDTNLWLTGFFKGKYPVYRNFLGGVELLGDFDNSPSGEIHCQSNVTVKYKLLMSQAQTQGVTGNAGNGNTINTIQQQAPPAQEEKPAQAQPKKTWGKRNF